MVRVREVIVVEGRYDKNSLSQVVDATILETRGFGVMKDKALLSFLRQAAEKRGLILLTDSDGAGFVIRNYLKGAIPAGQLKQAYIPDMFGKERRKAAPGKEGKLGVEGVPAEVIRQALEQAGVFAEPAEEQTRRITKTDLMEQGFSGGANSSRLRERLKKKLGLPEHLGTNALVGVLGCILSYEEFLKLAAEIRAEDESAADPAR